jgi:DNA-binding NarL/FixJ family response regulator
MPPYRILLAEDHIIFRELIKTSLGAIADLKIVGEVGDGLELLESLKVLTPHLVILDIGMPNLTGLEAAQEIKKTHPEIKILLLTMYKSKEHLKHALEAKVDGYLLKENAFKDLITAIDTIRDGKFYISDIISQRMVDLFLHRIHHEPKVSGTLSGREIEVLTHFAQGKSLREIAEHLLISYATVRNHITNIKKKLAISRNVELVKYALKEGHASIG